MSATREERVIANLAREEGAERFLLRLSALLYGAGSPEDSVDELRRGYACAVSDVSLALRNGGALLVQEQADQLRQAADPYGDVPGESARARPVALESSRRRH